MNYSNREEICLLDRIRLDSGSENLKKHFNKLAIEKREEAVELINHNNLNFCSLFVLQPEIEKNNLFSNLNARNSHAINVMGLLDNREYSRFKGFRAGNSQEVYTSLKWIIETGRLDDGLSNRYSQLLDIASILLVKEYRSKSILGTISEMIFIRYRLDLHIHDLVWAFFEAREPSSLLLIANGFLSKYPRDFELAGRLLSFIPQADEDTVESRVGRFRYANSWLAENRMFLYYTGESMQLTGRPVPYNVNLGAKYLHKPISVDKGEMLFSLSEWEQNLLRAFNNLDNTSKEVLASYSYRLAVQNPNLWRRWLSMPLPGQMNAVEAEKGGL